MEGERERERERERCLVLVSFPTISNSNAIREV